MNVINMLNELLNRVISENGFSLKEASIDVRPTKSREFGDYSSNVIFALAKENQKNPESIGQRIIQSLQEEIRKIPLIEKVELVNQGFINFFLNEIDLNELLTVIEKQADQYGMTEFLSKERVMVEFTDPNPFKVFHIGHLMTNTIGESLSRLIAFNKAQVKRANYQGDVGMHVAKSVWGMQRLMAAEHLKMDDLQKSTLEERINFLGRAYAFGATKFEEDEGVVEEIKQVNIYVYLAAQELLLQKENWNKQINYQELVMYDEKVYRQIQDLYQSGRVWSLEYFEKIYRLLGTEFDEYFFESKVGEAGLKIVREHIKDGIFEPSEGAYVFKGEKYGLHTRVFINSFGLPVYECKDLALAFIKKNKFDYTRSLIVTANEIDEYFQVVLKALSLIDPEIAGQTVHLGHGMLRLKSGKMSSRTGKVIAAMDLIEEIKTQVRKIMVGDRGLSENEQLEVLEKTAIAAWKYSVLKQKIGRDIVFDFQESVSIDGNSGPYLLYTYARIQSLMTKASPGSVISKEYVLQETEKELALMLVNFPSIIQAAGINYAPHMVCTYVFELAQKFNSYYGKTQIIAEDPEIQSVRLRLSFCIGQVIKNALFVLGISTLNRM